MTPHPCLSCGACCAYFRVGVRWSEAEPAGGRIPWDWLEPFSSVEYSMRGTSYIPARCAFLEGAVGGGVSCAVYDQRPRVCRAFNPIWPDGSLNESCDEARVACTLKPLTDDERGRCMHVDGPNATLIHGGSQGRRQG